MCAQKKLLIGKAYLTEIVFGLLCEAITLINPSTFITLASNADFFPFFCGEKRSNGSRKSKKLESVCVIFVCGKVIDQKAASVILPQTFGT